MYLNEVLKQFSQSIEDVLSVTVAEKFLADATLIEGSIVEMYFEEGRPEEYARDQIEFAIRCGAGNDSLLETPELKAYYHMKNSVFSSIGYMYNLRSNDDLLELAWEAFQVANPGAGRELFDGVRVGNPEALETLKQLHLQNA